MGNVISTKNKEYINSNWGDLKCSPIGPFLQSAGLAPGDPKKHLINVNPIHLEVNLIQV